ncbi:MAG: inclusion body family protein [Gloeotrichia echinulata GP01]
MSTELNQTAKKINVLVVIDTEHIKVIYPIPSQDKTKPTPVDCNSQFIIISGSPKIISGSETSKLQLPAKPGDNVSFRCTSSYANSVDAAIIYRMPLQENHVFECISFQPNFVTRNCAISDPEQPDGQAIKYKSITSVSYESKVSRVGTENLRFYIALYTLADDGNTQNLFGYFSWDIAITLQLDH